MIKNNIAEITKFILILTYIHNIDYLAGVTTELYKQHSL